MERSSGVDGPGRVSRRHVARGVPRPHRAGPARGCRSTSRSKTRRTSSRRFRSTASTPAEISWTMAAIDLDTIINYGGANWKYGFASHVHDGSYGSCPTCASIITTYPAVPRTSAISSRSRRCHGSRSTLGDADRPLPRRRHGRPRRRPWCLWLWIVLGAGAAGLGTWRYVDYRANRPWWPCTVSRRGWERIRGIESPPRSCEVQRTRWKAAERHASQ